MTLKQIFPVAEYALMREALLQHVSHVEARQGGHERVVELARLLDSLEFMPKNYAPSEESLVDRRYAPRVPGSVDQALQRTNGFRRRRHDDAYRRSSLRGFSRTAIFDIPNDCGLELSCILRSLRQATTGPETMRIA